MSQSAYLNIESEDWGVSNLLSNICLYKFDELLSQPAEAFISRLVGWSGDEDSAKGVLKGSS